MVNIWPKINTHIKKFKCQKNIVMHQINSNKQTDKNTLQETEAKMKLGSGRDQTHFEECVKETNAEERGEYVQKLGGNRVMLPGYKLMLK